MIRNFVKLITKKIMEQPTTNQNENKDDQHSNPK